VQPQVNATKFSTPTVAQWALSIPVGAGVDSAVKLAPIADVNTQTRGLNETAE